MVFDCRLNFKQINTQNDKICARIAKLCNLHHGCYQLLNIDQLNYSGNSHQTKVPRAIRILGGLPYQVLFGLNSNITVLTTECWVVVNWT